MRIAIVTGASSGMGREFVKQIDQLYKQLDEIWVIARRKERLLNLQKLVKTKIRVIEGDLLQEVVWVELKKLLSVYEPDIRMLVNAAGFGKVGNVQEISEKDQTEMVQLNCMALTRMTKICLSYMKKESRILQLASAAAFCPQPSFSVYAATKSYVLSFSRSLRTELRKEGIVVTTVCPGPVDTEFFQVSGKKEKNALKDSVMVKPQQVVRKALLDAKARKELSVYGVAMKGTRVATKIVPHGLILKFMGRFW